MKYILVLLSVVFLSGCTTVVPAVTQYKIKTQVVASEQNAQKCRNKSLKIAQAFSESSLRSSYMNYSQGQNKEYAYSQAEWSESPNISISLELLKHLKASKLFKSVVNSKSRSRSDMILEINIEDFMQYFNEDSTSSYSVVALDLTLIDTKTSSVVATQRFKVKVDTKTLDAEGGVIALSDALDKVIKQNIKWLNGVCE